MNTFKVASFILAFAAAGFLVYDGFKRSSEEDVAVAVRAALSAKIEAAIAAGDLNAVVALSADFLSSGDPWESEGPPSKDDPRNTYVKEARQDAIEALVLQGSIDGDTEAISRALDL